MNKKSKIYLVVLIWVATLLQLAINNSIDREKQMVEQVMSQGVENLHEGITKAYAYYGDESLTDNTKEEIVKSLAKKLRILSGYDITHAEIKDGRTTTLSKKGQYGDTTIKVISLDVLDNYNQPSVENYIMVELKLKGTAAKTTNNSSDTLEEIYRDLGMNPTMNIYLCSQEKGQLIPSERQQLVESFLDKMDAKVVEQVEYDDTFLVYGYSKNIDEYVFQNKDKVNVNIAFDYDETEDVTYIHMGVPFVDRSF